MSMICLLQELYAVVERVVEVAPVMTREWLIETRTNSSQRKTSDFFHSVSVLGNFSLGWVVP